MKLSGKTVVIAGASGGIGNALIERLAREEVHLIFIGRSEEKLKELVKRYGNLHKYYIADFTNEKSIQNLIKSMKKDLVKIDVLINSAGIGVYKPFPDVGFDELRDSFYINVFAPFWVTQGLLPLMRKSSSSVVVSMGSGMGILPRKMRSVYCATKFALRGMMLSLAQEIRGKRPQIVLITLGSTLTDFGPLTVSDKKRKMSRGKSYFKPDWVADKLTNIIKSESRLSEYRIFPRGYSSEV